MKKISKKKFIDPLIFRKRNITNNVHYDIANNPLPSVVEISESGTCNRACSFCPRSAEDYKDIKEFVSTELVEKLAKELAIFNYQGLFLFSGFVEPLLDKNIYNLIKIVRKYLGKARIEMVTNGDALNKERAKKLFDSGLTTLLISIYDGKKEANDMKQMLEDAKIPKEKYEIRHRYLSENDDFGITLSNRSGMMDNAKYQIPSLKEPLKKKCFYPHYTFFMDYTGEVLICSHDWGKKYVVGNLKNEKFIDIWLNQKFKIARKRLENADRNFSPCDVCDVEGVLMGKNHLDAWKKVNG
jgi:radical SAM protein with 4Fe4S-binding SPASM domain